MDFMIDVVDPDRLLQDALVTTGFQKSLSPEEVEYAKKKLTPPLFHRRPRPVTKPVLVVSEYSKALELEPVQSQMPVSNYEDALAALTDLGFKTAQAKKALEGIDVSLPIETLIKRALQGAKVA